ncbi:hypothetical protein VTN77DRAFT_7089 [Rasamsonia byssochlamydoides]|uniref:uncharacterized protein n=1 Tax=Rasamsonia byssochlamydoides TaxID=89139 RepID=UPI003743FFD5
MASTINSVPAANGASGNTLNSSTQNAGSARPSLRSNASLKGSDGGRRQSGSPGDGTQRRSNSQKAWTQGTNPITQKPTSYSQQNGGATHLKSAASPKPMTPKESSTPDNHAHDRLLFLLTSFIGLSAVITTKNGEKFNGIFSSSSFEPHDSSITLKMVQRVSPQTEQTRPNGLSDVASPYLGSAPDHSMSFDIKEIADVAVANVSTADMTAKEPNGASTGFRTDSDISGGLAIRERNLQRWEPSATDPSLDVPLESTGTAGWDQFEANERLFGATTSYDENLYTTRIDRSDPSYKRKEAEAARIAREIENSETDNPHVKEERGLAVEGDGHDEEEKYSGVRRDDTSFPPLQSGQPNKYTPPARRAAGQQQPAVSRAPAEPAVTSAQVARPDAAPQEPAASKTEVPSDTPQEKQLQHAKPSTTSRPAVTEQNAAAGQTAPTPTTTAATTTAATTTAATAAPKRTEGATTNVETEVLDHFRQFANSEKLKMQERRRNQASYDRTIKLNELMKFSKNFKLATPVPRDLVPILAKDPSKQEEIIERAQRQAEEKAAAKAAAAAAAAAQAASSSSEQKSATRAPAPATTQGATPTPAPPSAPSENRQSYPRGRQGYPPSGPHVGPGGRMPHQTMHPGRTGPGMLSHRLADNLRQQKGALGTVPTPLPIQDVRIPPSGPSADQSGISSPNKTHTPSGSSTKFNVRAMEFKPNPAASTFTPGASGVSISPQSSSRGQSVSRATSPSAFFGNKKPLPASERPSIQDQFNPIKRMKKESAEQTDKDYSFNGGIPPPYRTPPTWDVAPGNEDKTYADMFKAPVIVPSISPQSRSSSNPHLPHQPQLPYHLHQAHQSVPSTAGPPHGPHHLHPQQHHGAHFDDHHRMQMSASTSQIFPSPRLQHSHVAYPSPMGPHAQLAFGQPMPQFYVNQGAPQPAHMRQYPGAPQFVPQNGIGAPMMVQQPSSGPYMGVPQAMAAPYTPQMQMYSPSPAHAYPHVAPPPQPHSGYPSPSRGAPMMMHQGSQPGQPPQPVMFMSPAQHGQPMYVPQQPGHIPPVRAGYPQQPHFSSSPHQVQHYPPHQHRAPSNSYGQVPQMPPHMPSQPPPAPASGPHPAEGTDDAK